MEGVRRRGGEAWQRKDDGRALRWGVPEVGIKGGGEAKEGRGGNGRKERGLLLATS
jgi:hypothetical protein